MKPDRPNVYGVSRDLWEHPEFAKEPFTEREAWMWLIGAAAWKALHTRGNAGAVRLQRGEFSFSVRFLADKWKWTKDRAHRFVQRLQKRDMLRDTSRDGSQVYYINNYNKFQVVGVPTRDINETASATPVRRKRDSTATGARQHRDKEETGETCKTGKALSGARAERDDGFNAFWAAYPKKAGKPHAKTAYAKALGRATAEAILHGAQRYALSREGQDSKYTKMAQGWLNDDRWLDDVEIPQGQGPPINWSAYNNPEEIENQRRLLERLNVENA